MPKTPHRRNAKKQSARFAALGRAKRLMNLKRKSEPLIPDEVLHKISDLNLPNNPWLYNLVLRELLRDAT